MSSFATRAVHGVLKVIEGSNDTKLCIEGHSRPDEDSSIATKRANAVLEHLVSQGVPRHRLRVAGFGSSCPDESGECDGRVEFSVIQEISIKGTVQFSQCSDSLTSASGPLLDKVVALLVARPCLRVRVEGHTDSSPNWGCSNLELSQGRSQNVVEYLSQHGVDESRLAAVGFGDKLPRLPNSTSDGRSKNRRVEFHVLQKDTIQGLQNVLGQHNRRTQVDEHGLRQLERTATGVALGLSLPIRVAAADLLVRLQADWPIQRLFHLAARLEDPARSPVAQLPDDCVQRILRMYFLLGCSSFRV